MVQITRQWRIKKQVWWPFIECIEAAKGKKKEGLKSVDKCAKDNKIDGAAVKKCGEGDEGEKLLKAQQAKEDAFLAEPATKVFVKKNAEDTFKCVPTLRAWHERALLRCSISLDRGVMFQASGRAGI